MGQQPVRHPGDWTGNRKVERDEDRNLVEAGSLGRGKPTSRVL